MLIYLRLSNSPKYLAWLCGVRNSCLRWGEAEWQHRPGLTQCRRPTLNVLRYLSSVTAFSCCVQYGAGRLKYCWTMLHKQTFMQLTTATCMCLRSRHEVTYLPTPRVLQPPIYMPSGTTIHLMKHSDAS